MKTDSVKIINRKFISEPLFQTERKSRKEPVTNATGEINPKNRHCLRGLDGKYGRWDPKPETIQKPADFLPEEETTPGPSN